MRYYDVFIAIFGMFYVFFLVFNSLIFKELVGISDLLITSISAFFYLIFIFFIRSKFRINILYFFLVSSCIFSIVFNDIPAEFQSELRFVGWLLLVIALSPFVYNKSVGKIRFQAFTLLMTSFIIITVLSFIYDVLGLPNLGRGHFTGIMVHSMILAPISAISSICCVIRISQARFVQKKLMYILLTIISLYIVVISGSRAALVGCFFVFLVMFILSKARFKYIIVFLVSSVFIMGGSIFQIDAPTSSGVLEDRGNTRELLWLNRIVEFQSSPLVGVGFASERELRLPSTDKTVKVEKGSVEPGSGYLMLLSMTGLLGFLSFILILGKNIYQLYRCIKFNGRSNSSYCFYVLLFFCLHFIGEGYVYSFGSLMGATFWLLLGAARYSLDYNNSVELDFKRYLQ